LPALEISEEFIQGIVTTLLRFVRCVSRLRSSVQGIVDVAIRWVRCLGRVMSLVILGRAMRIALARDGVQRGLKVVSSCSIASWVKVNSLGRRGEEF
jgi:hypothetical protein